MKSLLRRVLFPITLSLSSLSTFKRFSLLLLFFWHCLQQKFLTPPLSEPLLPAAQSLSTVSHNRRSLRESTGKALIKHPVAVTSLSSNPSWILFFLLLLLLQEIPAPSHHRATLCFVLSQVRGHCGQFWPARHVWNSLCGPLRFVSFHIFVCFVHTRQGGDVKNVSDTVFWL